MPINYKEYPENWKKEIRPAILKRAKNKCEWCGLHNYQIIKRLDGNKYRKITAHEKMKIIDITYFRGKTYAAALKELGLTRIILTVAHIDHDKENKDIKLNRLATLCQKCHLNHDSKQRAANRKYGKKHREHNLKLEI